VTFATPQNHGRLVVEPDEVDTCDKQHVGSGRSSAPVFGNVRRGGSGGDATRREECGGVVAVKLHRCSTPWRAGPCWRVQKALAEQSIAYEVVSDPSRPGKRVELERLSGQRLHPVIEFENGSVYREESKEMEATIRAGRLDEKRGAPMQRTFP
jgi:hypothetical protein